MSTSRHHIGILYALVGAIASSGKAIIVKLLLSEGIDPITSLGMRMSMAAPIFAGLALWSSRGNDPPVGRHFGRIVLLGFTGYYLASTLDFLGLALISASLERLILYVYPTLVLLFVRLRGGPPIRARQWVAMAISYTGVLVAFGAEAQHTMAVSDTAFGDVLLGTALVLGSGATYALYMVLSGSLVGRFGALRLTGLASCVACVFCIGQFAIVRPAMMVSVTEWMTARVFWLCLFNATVCTVMPMWMVMRGIQLIGAGSAAQISMVGPLATMLLATVLLGEPFTLPMILGTSLVLLGIAWLTRRR